MSKEIKLETKAQNTWCPGCGNFGIYKAVKGALGAMIQAGTPQENFVLVSGIGCGSKIIDYLNVNTFSSLHGRPVAAAQGIKLGNPDLKVIVSTGDGGAYNEGVSHLIHAAKRNIDITVLVHNNRNFALTTGQFTATSPQGFKGTSTPKGSVEKPFDPLNIMLDAGATFIARGYAFKMDHLQNLVKKAIDHKGFSFVDILQPCITFFDTAESYNERVYEMEKPESEQETLKKMNEWNYEKGNNEKIPIGVFCKKDEEIYEEKLLKELNPSQHKKDFNFKEFLNVQS